MDDLRERLLSILRTVLENEHLDETVSQNNCEEWDSLHHLQLIVALESEFDVILEPEEISEMQDFETVLTIISQKK